jgi:hypothetical protein
MGTVENIESSLVAQSNSNMGAHSTAGPHRSREGFRCPSGYDVIYHMDGD